MQDNNISTCRSDDAHLGVCTYKRGERRELPAQVPNPVGELAPPVQSYPCGIGGMLRKLDPECSHITYSSCLAEGVSRRFLFKIVPVSELSDRYVLLDSRTILQGCKDENREATVVRQKPKAYWDKKFKNKELNAVMDVLMV